MSRRRVTIYDNRNPGEAKLLALPDNTDMKHFLYLAGQKLNFIATKAYLVDGAEIDDAHLIRDNDIIFISAGEPFSRVSAQPQRISTLNNTAQTNGNGTNNNNNNQPILKSTYSIAVMGPGSVGKSALTLRYVQGIFVRDYDPTIEDAYRKSVHIDGEACTLDILDTAGQEDYIALRSTWMRERDGFVLVFSLTDRQSFDGLAQFYEQLQSMHEDGLPPLLLIGNKADLESKRVVSKAEGKQRAEQYNNSLYLETSAATGEGVDKVFSTLVGKIRQAHGYNAQAAAEARKKKSSFWCTIL